MPSLLSCSNGVISMLNCIFSACFICFLASLLTCVEMNKFDQESKGYAKSLAKFLVCAVFSFAFFLCFVLPAFLDTGLPRGNRHERDSLDPRKVPSIPNPTSHRGWPHHRDLRPLLFSNSCVGSYAPHEQISVSAVRRDLRFFVLIRED